MLAYISVVRRGEFVRVFRILLWKFLFLRSIPFKLDDVMQQWRRSWLPISLWNVFFLTSVDTNCISGYFCKSFFFYHVRVLISRNDAEVFLQVVLEEVIMLFWGNTPAILHNWASEGARSKKLIIKSMLEMTLTELLTVLTAIRRQ